MDSPYNLNDSHFPRLQTAIVDAAQFHLGQDRKYSKVPYICHPIAVMEIVRTVTDDEDLLIAAVLHDLVEDTHATIDYVESTYGSRVSQLIDWLTDVSKPEDGNRKTRKDIDLTHTAAASPDAQTIKLADLIHNAESITASDPNFAKVFMHEMARMLDVLSDGNSELYSRATDALKTYQNSLLRDSLNPNR